MMMKATIFVLLAILALASAGRLCCPSEDRNENRKTPEKSENARKAIGTQAGTSGVNNTNHAGNKHLQRLRMYDPKLYHSANQIQRRDARETLLRCPLVNNWHTGSLLDIGCGSGDVTMEIITRVLPENFERLVGADLSEEMVRFARERCSHPCISFEQLDIGLELDKQKLRDIEPFDHITSFNCLHWITRGQPITVENMYKLLKPGGDMLLLFVVTHPIYKVFKELSTMNDWTEYMTDVEKIFSPYYYSNDPAGEYDQLLRSNGFTETNVTVREMPYTFETIESLRNTFAAVNPFLNRIPEQQREKHLDDMVQLFTERYSEHIIDAGFSVPYKSIVAYAKKPYELPSTSYDRSLPSTSNGNWSPIKCLKWINEKVKFNCGQ